MEDILYAIGLHLDDTYTLINYCSINTIMRNKVGNNKCFWLEQFKKYELSSPSYTPKSTIKWFSLLLTTYNTIYKLNHVRFSMDMGIGFGEEIEFRNLTISINKIQSIIQSMDNTMFNLSNKVSHISGKYRNNDFLSIIQTYPFIINHMKIKKIYKYSTSTCTLKLYVNRQTNNEIINNMLNTFDNIVFKYCSSFDIINNLIMTLIPDLST